MPPRWLLAAPPTLFPPLAHHTAEEQFDELCFEYGIELDEVTTEETVRRKESGQHTADAAAAATGVEEVIYKIDVPANRYDLLCVEGISRALNIFRKRMAAPAYTLVPAVGAAGTHSGQQKITVSPEVALVRPFVVCAVLRGVTFDEKRYKSFIDLQDKLHQNLCKRRELVAIGTHDLSKLRGPFTYEALPPKDIRFVPLKPAEQDRDFTADELLEYYDEHDRNLRKFNHIIRDSIVYPVLYDADRTVLSLPPIINGAKSAITLQTRDIFIECTATDAWKASMVLDTMVTMFSEYCERPFEIEPVEVVGADGSSKQYPELTSRELVTDVGYINRSIGAEVDQARIVDLLTRMQLPARAVAGEGGAPAVAVTIPPTRTDVIHPCDVMEDVAISYGYDNIEQVMPATVTQGRQQPINKMSDLLRGVVAQAGYIEILTFALCSHEENFKGLLREDDGQTGVVIGNPKGADFEVARSALLPGMLKTASANRDAALPLKLFEVSDVCLLDSSKDVGARNERHLMVLYSATTSGFEQVHGVLDKAMQALGVAPAAGGDAASGYSLAEGDDPSLFAGRQAAVLARGKRVGSMGIVRPEVLANFEINFPCSVLEMDIEWALSEDGQR